MAMDIDGATLAVQGHSQALSDPMAHLQFMDDVFDAEIFSPFNFGCARTYRLCNGPEGKDAYISG